jgi:hypothetical protein
MYWVDEKYIENSSLSLKGGSLLQAQTYLWGDIIKIDFKNYGVCIQGGSNMTGTICV